jgi:hypothetical protein
MRDPFKKMLPWESEFDHRWACWANNHNGWARMKKFNKKVTKHREKQILDKEMKKENEE